MNVNDRIHVVCIYIYIYIHTQLESTLDIWLLVYQPSEQCPYTYHEHP